MKKKFIKDLIKKQVDLSAHLIAIYSDNPLLNAHFLLLLNIQNSNFHKILSPRLTTQLTITNLQKYLDRFWHKMLMIVSLINAILLIAIKKISVKKQNSLSTIGRGLLHRNLHQYHLPLVLLNSNTTHQRCLAPHSFEFQKKKKKAKVYNKLMNGNYQTLEEMDTNINGGQKSKAIEQIVYKNM